MSAKNDLSNFTTNCLALPAAIIGSIQGVIWLILSLISILYYNNAIEPSATLDSSSYGYVIYQLYLESTTTTGYEIDSKSFNIFMYLYMVLSFVWLIISVALLWASLRKKWNKISTLLVCWSSITIIISILDITLMSLMAADLQKAQSSSTVPAVFTTTDSTPFSSTPNPTLSTSTTISPTDPTTFSTTYNPTTTTSNMPTTYYFSTVTIPTTITVSTTSTPIPTTLKPTIITTKPTISTTTNHSPTTSTTTSYSPTTSTTTSYSPTTSTTTTHSPITSTTTSHSPTTSTTTSHSPTTSTTTLKPTIITTKPTTSTTTSHSPTTSTSTLKPTIITTKPTISTTTSHSPTTSTSTLKPTIITTKPTTSTTTSHSPTTSTSTLKPTIITTKPTISTTTSHSPTTSTTTSLSPTNATTTSSSPKTTSHKTTANTPSSTPTEITTSSSTHYIPTNTPSTTSTSSEARNSRSGHINYNFGEVKTGKLITHYTTLSLNMHYPLFINPKASKNANRAMDLQTVCTAIAFVMSLAARGYVLLILNLTIAIILLAITLHKKRQNTRSTMRRTIINAYANGLSSVYDQVEIDKSFQNEGFESDEYIFGIRSNENNVNGKNPLSNSNRSSIINAQTSSYPFEKVEPLRLPSVQARLAKIGKAGGGRNSPPRRVPSPSVPTTFNGYPHIPEPDYTPPSSPKFQPKSVLRPKSNYEF